MKFRSKPVEIEATEYRYPDMDAVAEFAAPSTVKIGDPHPKGGRMLIVSSRQGPVSANPGDWIIRESDGSGVYPCAPDVFVAKYEPA